MLTYKKIIFIASIGIIFLTVAPTALWAEVYDLDALTDGVDDQSAGGSGDKDTNNNSNEDQSIKVGDQNTNVNGNATTDTTKNTNVDKDVNADTQTYTNVNINTNKEPSEIAITLAECMIFNRLEIYDSRCDELARTIKCPFYAECLSACENNKTGCIINSVNKKGADQYNACITKYNSSLDDCASRSVECSQKFPPRNVEGDVQSFQLVDSTGDVRVTYDDNPTPFDMESVSDERSIQVGATIFTGDKASTRIMLPNGTTQMLGPNTYFRVAEYYSSNNVDETITILKNGNARIKVAKPGDEESEKKVEYLVITPLWKVEAKGTEFDLTVSENGTTKLMTLSGEVELHDHEDKLIAAVPAGENLSTDSEGNIDEYSSGVFFPSAMAYYVNAYGKMAIAVSIILLVAIIGAIIFIIKRKKSQKVKNRKK